MNLKSKFNQISKAREQIESELRLKMKEIGSGQVSEITGERQQNISQFMAGTRQVSIKKLKEWADKLL